MYTVVWLADPVQLSQTIRGSNRAMKGVDFVAFLRCNDNISLSVKVFLRLLEYLFGNAVKFTFITS